MDETGIRQLKEKDVSQDERFNRIDDKIDRVKDSVSELKTEMALINTKFESHIKIVEEHVAGDQKIIDVLVNIIPELSEMAEYQKARRIIQEDKKAKREERVAKLKSWSAGLAVVATVVGIVAGVLRISAV